MVITASSWSSAVSAAMSYPSKAATYRSRSLRCSSSSGFAVSGAELSVSASVARALCRALLTEATVVSRSSATSLAFHARTSRRISTARCLGGRCCSAATKARRTDSRATAASAGSATEGRMRPSGIGSSQVFSGSGLSAACASGVGPVRSTGRARLLPAFSMSRHTFVAIRYSHERSEERPSNLSKLRQARTSVSWTASSASKAEPSIR